MPNLRAAFLGLAAAIGFNAPVNANNGPTLQQIYDQAREGHLDQAQQMIHQVLVDHPQSAKAHFVAAEIASLAGKLAVARGELEQAEHLDPGLAFANPAAVRALKSGLGADLAGGDSWMLQPREHIFPWFPGILLSALGFVIWAIVRRRGPLFSTDPGESGYLSPVNSRLAGGLAAALAAREDIARNALRVGHQPGTTVNAVRGGEDFGVNDAGGWL